ncbi:hypothetical protein VTN49DRAFT_6385 [Thermomyces lanuginosus]|uniref:uncharacterized protein n=1 Tax=Thermomyces lanuginosus TaxID=5541 RepID=UPI003742C988
MVELSVNGGSSLGSWETGPKYYDNEPAPITPNKPELVPGLLDRVISLAKTFDLNNNKERLSLLEALRSLIYALETPHEANQRQRLEGITCSALVDVAVDLGVWQILSKDDKPRTVAELAAETGADPALLSRIMKHLSSNGTIIETGPNEYRRTNFALAMSMRRFADGSRLFHYFEFLENHPEYARQFNAYMSFYHQGRPGWMDFYDVRRLCSNIGPDDVLLVDIGGNVGHDLSEFKRKWPDAPGRLILQDLPKVIKHAKESGLPSYIEPMEHDFFTEQPIKGMYQSPNLASIHRRKRFIVLHEQCRKILENLAPAMKRGFSKLLINEIVISDTGASWESTCTDISMMCLVASQERTATQWQELLESTGFKITNIWTDMRSAESLIECDLA